METLENTLREQLAALSLPVPAAALPRLLWFLDELLRWNRRINLTAIADPREGIEKHLVDSLTPLPLLPAAGRLLDLGSGGGFPGLPLKLVRPDLQVVSVESVGRKASFQRHVVRHLDIIGFEVLTERAEDLPRRPGFAAGFQVVIARAFTSLSAFADLALPCLAPGGLILAMKGAEGERELAAAGEHLRQLGLIAEEVRKLRLPVSGAERTLLLLRAEGSEGTAAGTRPGAD